MSLSRASPGISLGADNHGRLFQKSVRDRTKKPAKSSTTLAAQYRLNVSSSKSTPSVKVIRPTKHDMVQVVRDEVEASNVFDSAKPEEAKEPEHKEPVEMKLLDLDESMSSDDDLYNEVEDPLEMYFSRSKPKTCQTYYSESCSKMKITQLSNFYKALDTDEVKVIGVTLRPKDIKACAIALSRECEVEKMTFTCNDLQTVGAIYLSDVITQNEYLVDVKITENNIGSDGAKAICDALKNNNYLRKLDLSGNNLTEDDAIFFKEMLDENHALRELHLRHNKFREKGGEIFAEGLAVNDFLKVLDLSWNHLRLRGATAIGRALQDLTDKGIIEDHNRHLEKLDISWNGFHLTGAATISYALTKNTTLLELDMSCNRLTDKCAQCLIKGLQQNNTLKVLRLGKNQMYPISAQNLLECIDQNNTGIELLDLGDQCVFDTFVELYNTMVKKRPFKAIYGYIWDTKRDGISQWDVKEEDLDLLDEDPLLILFEYSRLQNFRLIDMFMILDTDKSGSLDKKEFKEGLEQVMIPMEDSALNLLIKKMDKDGDGEIDFGEMMAAHKLHSIKLREYMRSELPIEQTEIGRIDRKLRAIMSKKHLMKKKKKPTKPVDLLKVLRRVSLTPGEDLPNLNPNGESDDQPSMPTILETKPKSEAPKLSNLMNFLPVIKRNTSMVTEDKDVQTDGGAV